MYCIVDGVAGQYILYRSTELPVNIYCIVRQSCRSIVNIYCIIRRSCRTNTVDLAGRCFIRRRSNGRILWALSDIVSYCIGLGHRVVDTRTCRTTSLSDEYRTVAVALVSDVVSFDGVSDFGRLWRLIVLYQSTELPVDIYCIVG